MKKSDLYALCMLFGLLFTLNTSHAFVAIFPTAFDIDNRISVYNYEITTTCIGLCSDTIGGVPIPDLNITDEFFIPFFPDAGISSILSPTGWSGVIEANNDLFGLGNNAGVIHWSASAGNELALNDSLSGFMYSSTVSGSVKAPFRLHYTAGGFLDGDPPIPASPLALQAGLKPVSQVPLPAAVWLFGSALLGLVGFRKFGLR